MTSASGKAPTLTAELIRRRPIRSFLKLEAELSSADTTEARRATAETCIKTICNLANLPAPLLLGPDSAASFGEHFILLLRSRWRSSGDAVEYYWARDRLLLQLREAFPAAEEHRRKRAVSTSERDRQMAEEFLAQKRSTSSHQSDSALKANIGKRHELKRSAAIAAINRGLKSLQA